VHHVQIVDYSQEKTVGKLEEIHPGEILTEEFVKPMGIANARSASDIDVPASRCGRHIPE
jgi:plasmid maintenance system antidote protein VapI